MSNFSSLKHSAAAGIALAFAAGWLVQAPASAHTLLPPEAARVRAHEAVQAGADADEIVLAVWSVTTCGSGVCVRNGQTAIPMPSDRVATRTAKEFNRIEKRAEKRAEGDGFLPTGSGECSDPRSGVLC